MYFFSLFAFICRVKRCQRIGVEFSLKILFFFSLFCCAFIHVRCHISHRNLNHFNLNTPCRLHGSPKTATTNVISPLHRLQSLDIMDNVPLTYSRENQSTTTTPVVEHTRLMTPKRLQSHHQLHSMTNDLATITSTHVKSKGISGSVSSSFDGLSAGTTSSNVNGVYVGDNSASQHQFSSHSKQSTSHHSSHQRTAQQQHSQQQHCTGTQSHRDGCMLRHRWQICPELHKAMNGVNYIADHTKKEEESTKVRDNGDEHHLQRNSIQRHFRLFTVQFNLTDLIVLLFLLLPLFLLIFSLFCQHL